LKRFDMKVLSKELLLHACCAPCSTIALERLNSAPVIFWYNPNIEPRAEHDKRYDTLRKFAKKTGLLVLSWNYDYLQENEKWHQFIQGLEKEKEGSIRCSKCYLFRLSEARRKAEEFGYITIATTLTTSKFKNSDIINTIGNLAVQKTDIRYLETDFKENNGYYRSIELSKKFDLYRQNYCGCIYSMKN